MTDSPNRFKNNRRENISIFSQSSYIVLFFFCLSFFISSCSDDNVVRNNAFRLDFVTVCIDNSFLYFRLDDGTILYIPANSNYNLSELTDGERLLLQYTTLSENVSEKQEIIDLHGLRPIAVSKIMPLAEALESDIGNDAIGIESIWISGDFINLSFYIYYDSEVHSILLIESTHKLSQTNDTVYLELRHNAHNDQPLFKANGIVSFDISPYKNRKPVIFSIEASTYTEGTKVYNRLFN